MELLLLRPEGQKILGERALYFKERYGEHGATTGAEAERVQKIQRMPNEIQQTKEEAAKNDGDFLVKSDLLPDLTRFIEEFKESEPLALVKVLTKKLGRGAAVSDQLLLESAINRVISASVLDKDGEGIVMEAINALAAIQRPKAPGGKSGGAGTEREVKS